MLRSRLVPLPVHGLLGACQGNPVYNVHYPGAKGGGKAYEGLA